MHASAANHSSDSSEDATGAAAATAAATAAAAAAAARGGGEEEEEEQRQKKKKKKTSTTGHHAADRLPVGPISLGRILAGFGIACVPRTRQRHILQWQRPFAFPAESPLPQQKKRKKNKYCGPSRGRPFARRAD